MTYALYAYLWPNLQLLRNMGEFHGSARPAGRFTSVQSITQMKNTASMGAAVPTVEFRNCRHGFGAPLSFDVVVDGMYPTGSACILLSQPAEVENGVKLKPPTAYLSIPEANPSHARAVLAAITPYYLCGKFRKGEPIDVSLCWPHAPIFDGQLLVA